MKFARESIPFVLPPAGLAILLAALGRPLWAAVGGALTLAVLLFFRIPRRTLEGPAEALLAPANGRVLSVERLEEESLPGVGPCYRVATFLSVFNVHVQRAPCAGEIVSSDFRPGRKIAAFRSQVGEVNERHATVIQRPNGDRIAVLQLAGLLARRVVGYARPGDTVSRGQLIGVIKFGSRVDLLLPLHYEVQVKVGAVVREGETIVALAIERKTP